MGSLALLPGPSPGCIPLSLNCPWQSPLPSSLQHSHQPWAVYTGPVCIQCCLYVVLSTPGLCTLGVYTWCRVHPVLSTLDAHPHCPHRLCLQTGNVCRETSCHTRRPQAGLQELGVSGLPSTASRGPLCPRGNAVCPSLHLGFLSPPRQLLRASETKSAERWARCPRHRCKHPLGSGCSRDLQWGPQPDLGSACPGHLSFRRPTGGSPQTSTMTSFLTCFKGVGVGTGTFLSQKIFGALGILCPREAPSVTGAGLGLVTRTVPWTPRTTTPEPQAGVWKWGQGGSWSGGECGGAKCPGSASPLIHSCSHSHSWAPLPRGRQRGRLGCHALVLRPLPSGEHPRPRCCCLCPVPVCQAHGGPHRWGLEWFPEFHLLASPGSGGADASGGRGFPWRPFSCPAHSP